MQNLLTYDEAAAMLGTTSEAVRCRAKRGRWHKVVGNDGRTRIRLPEGADDRAVTGQQPGDDRARPGDDALAVEVRLLREMLDAMRDERDHWRAMAERLSEPRKPLEAVTAILSRMRAKAA